jgi:D-glycero-alpha-D-manno-heptose 1-phosphate guanylyltransferase
MDVIILAGGLGTRLRSVITDVPKPMAAIADRPFLVYLLDYLIAQKISNHFILSVGYQYQKIIDYFGNNYQSFPLTYSIEYNSLGTGGGIKLALSHAQTEQVLILNGDTLFNVNLSEMFDCHCQQQAQLTLALKPLNNFERYHNVLRDKQGQLIGFEDKKFQTQGLINGGVYIVNNNLLSRFNLPEKFSFEEDFLKPNLQEINIYGFISTAYFIDIGIPEDYQKSQIEFPELFNSRNQV